MDEGQNPAIKKLMDEELVHRNVKY